MFLLTFFGFAVKAGLVPVNSWLPRAYTAAPACFLPVLAGAMLNLGFYGIMRVNLDLVPMTHAGSGIDRACRRHSFRAFSVSCTRQRRTI